MDFERQDLPRAEIASSASSDGIDNDIDLPSIRRQS